MGHQIFHWMILRLLKKKKTNDADIVAEPLTTPTLSDDEDAVNMENLDEVMDRILRGDETEEDMIIPKDEPLQPRTESLLSSQSKINAIDTKQEWTPENKRTLRNQLINIINREQDYDTSKIFYNETGASAIPKNSDKLVDYDCKSLDLSEDECRNYFQNCLLDGNNCKDQKFSEIDTNILNKLDSYTVLSILKRYGFGADVSKGKVQPYEDWILNTNNQELIQNNKPLEKILKNLVEIADKRELIKTRINSKYEKGDIQLDIYYTPNKNIKEKIKNLYKTDISTILIHYGFYGNAIYDEKI